MELSHHELPSGWIAAGYTDDDGRFWHVATLRTGATDEQIKVATLRAMGAFDTFVLAAKKLCRGLSALFAAATASAPEEPAENETWHVRLPGGSALSTALVLEVTERTALLRFGSSCTPSRYALSDLEFVEKVSE